jgi:RNA polymerase sigma-32 factor
MHADATDDLDPQLRPEALDEPAPDGLVPAGRGGLVPVDPFRRYLAEIRRYPPLGREEELALARRYRDTGDREALFRLVTANLRLVVRVALSFRRAARNLLDLIQEGNLGLLAAIERFDPELGVRLPTYAGWWVRAYMIKYLLDNVRLVRVGTTNARRKLLRNLRREQQRLEGLGYEVGPRLLAEHFGVSEEDVTDVQKALRSRDVSLDEPLPGDDERRQVDVLPAADGPTVEETVARRELAAQAHAAIDEFRRDLDERERTLLDERILADDPKTLQALGDRFGTTREAVRQAEVRLKKRLEHFLRDRLDDLGRVRIGPS